uniref:Uncharacterized protein n=1 Tax=Mus spicilegus TaxID=10103 RepID=A0A8C6HJ54_MUSSI
FSLSLSLLRISCMCMSPLPFLELLLVEPLLLGPAVCFIHRLENCHLTEACCKDLSSILMVSRTLTHLSLANNKLGDNGEA